MIRRYDKWSVPIINVLKSKGFVRNVHAIPRSIFVFNRDRAGVHTTVELRDMHLLRVLQNGREVCQRANVSVDDAFAVIYGLK